MTIRLSAVSVLGLGFCWLATGCGAADAADNQETVTLELATHIAALEVNQDGSDVESADATEPEPMLMRSCGLAQVREKLVERFDVDRSDDLDEDERQDLSEEYGGAVRPGHTSGRHVARLMRLRRLINVYDIDESGDLDDAERETLGADLQERCEARQAALIALYDADESGSLDDEEWQVAHEAIRQRFAENHRKIVDAFDRNDDGKLGPAERHIARQAKRDEMAERRDAIRTDFDVDDSGDLDDAEREALQDDLRERVRTPRIARDAHNE